MHSEPSFRNTSITKQAHAQRIICQETKREPQRTRALNWGLQEGRTVIGKGTILVQAPLLQKYQGTKVQGVARGDQVGRGGGHSAVCA